MKIVKRLTEAQIEQLAAEIIDYCKRHEFGDTIVYYNGKRTFINYDGDNSTEPADVHNYLEYCGNTLSVSFEGSMYDIFNYHYGDWGYNYVEEFNKIIEKYNLYYEHGNSWNISLYYDGILEEDNEKYIPSSTAGDYSPSNPWDAPGMSISDFI